MIFDNSKRMESLTELMDGMRRDGRTQPSLRKPSTSKKVGSTHRRRGLDTSMQSTRSNASVKSTSTVKSDRSSKSNRSNRSNRLLGHKEMDRKHVIAIQQTWELLKSNTENFKKTFGNQLIFRMGASKTARVSSSQSCLSADCGSKLIDGLESIIHIIGPTMSDEDFVDKGEEWLDMGIDVREVHKALVGNLKDSLGENEYTHDVARAWETTFRDVIMKTIPSN